MDRNALTWTARSTAARELGVLGAALEALEDAVCVHDERGDVVVANPAALAILGADRRQLLAGDRGAVPYLGRLGEVLRDGRPLRSIVLEHVRVDDGRRRWLRANLEPSRDECGRISGVVASFSDITDEDAMRAFRLLGRQLRSLFDDRRLAVSVADLEHRIVFASPGYARAVGRPGEDLRNRTEDELMSPEVAARRRRQAGWAVVRRESVTADEVMHERTFSTTKVPLLDDRGEPFAVMCIGVDITGVRAEEAELQRVARELRLQLDSVDEGVVLVDRELRVISMNATAHALLQRDDGPLTLWEAEVVDVPVGEGPEAPTGPLPALLRTVLSDGAPRRDVLARLSRGPEGEPRWCAVDVVPTADGSVVVALRDVTDAQREQRELVEAAYRDPLTGLGNRRLFEETLALALGRARRHDRPLAVCMLDVDKLKQVNDRYGHAAGDRVLQRVGDALRDELRGADLTVRATQGVLSSRYGGDEFLLLFEDLVGEPLLAAEAALARVRAALADDPEGDGTPVTISAGVAVFPEDGSDAATLVARADARMYEYKRRNSGKTGGTNSLEGA